MRRRVHLFISGRVQGVSFRDSTRVEAERAGVTGWVRNLPDGRVEAVLDGPAERVADIVAWCHHGPPGAHVQAVEAVEAADVGGAGEADDDAGFADFRIRP